MLDLVEIDFSVVYSIKDDGIKLSVRSGGKINAGTVTNDALAGIGGGGGHASMAGGFVPVTADNTNIKDLTGHIAERFLATIPEELKQRH